MFKKINKIFFWLVLLQILQFFPQKALAADLLSPWTRDSDLNQQIANQFVVSVGKYILSIDGTITHVSPSIERLDTTLTGSDRTWSEIGNLPYNSYWSGGASQGNKIYSLGGTQYPPQTSIDNSIYATVDDSGNISNWQTITPLPSRLSKGAAAISGNYIYFSGGWTDNEQPSSASNKVYYSEINSDGSLGVWNVTTNLPDITYGHKMIEHNNFLYVIGGWNSNGRSSTVLRAQINSDGTLGSWQTMASLPTPREMLGAVIFNNYIIVVGGGSNNGLTDSTYFTVINNDNSLEPWETSTQILPANHCCGDLTINSDYLYLIGGGYEGEGYTSKVYRDKLSNLSPSPTPLPTPTPTPAPSPSPSPTLTPIILIPGLGASWNYDALVHNQNGIADAAWKIAPYVKEYDGLISSLINAGYVKDINLFVYAYDWRHDINQTANNLNNFVENRFAPGTKISLIGHSLGGLIGRIYTNTHTNRIKTLYTLGSPHQGSVSAYKIWEGADFSDFSSWEKLGLDLYLHTTAGLFNDEVNQIHSIYPVFLDIWPRFNFVKNLSNQVVQNSNLHFSNPLLVSFDLNLTKTISGTNSSTNKFIKTQPRSTLDALYNKWIDGSPISYESDNGDNTVLKNSAQITGTLINQEFSGITHRQLPSNTGVEQYLLNDLGLSGSPVSIVQQDLNKAILVTVASPVNFKINTPNGVVIPQDSVAVINNPQNGNYNVVVTPQGSGGDYILYFGKFNGSDVAWDEVHDNVKTGHVDTHSFSVNLNNSSLGSNPIKQINDYLDDVHDTIYDCKLTIFYKLSVLPKLVELRFKINSLLFINKLSLFDKKLIEINSNINSFPINKFSDGDSHRLTLDFNFVKQLLLQYRGDRF